jgi:hypothetical protein
MIKKFIIDGEVYIFIEADERIISIREGKNGKLIEYTVKSIVSLPETELDALQMLGLNIWYSIDDIA